MNANYHLKEGTANRKLTDKPNKFVSATTSSWITCSKHCPLYKDCYAKKGPTSWNANKVSNFERGYDFTKLIDEIVSLRPKSFLRLNVSGDLPSVTYKNDERKISISSLNKLYNATKENNITAYTYTHLHCDPKHSQYNLEVIKKFSTNKFTINISTENRRAAVKHYLNGHDVVITDTKLFNYAVKQQLETGRKSKLYVDGNTVDLFPCDAQYKESNCNKCRKCSEYNRSEIVIFKKH